MDIVRNPVVIGLFVGTMTYAYLSHSAKDKNKNDKNYKKQKINLMIPLVMALIGWFIAYAYFENKNDKIVPAAETQSAMVSRNNIQLPLPISPSPQHFIKDVVSESTTSDPKSFELLKGGSSVNIPDNLPDVFLEMK
jgi:flagellar basal body-associated protein FliL